MKSKDLLSALVITLIWGLNFVMVKIGLQYFSPLFFCSLRFILSAFPAVFFIKRDGISWKWIILIGLILGVFQFALVFIGIDLGMPAGLTALILQSHIAFTCILGALIFKDRPNWKQITGIAIAFSGILLIGTETAHTGFNVLAFLLIICSAVSFSTASIIMKLAAKVDMFRLIIWSSLIPPLPLMALSFIAGEEAFRTEHAFNIESIGTLCYMAFLSTILAFGLWGKLLKKYAAHKVAPLSLLVPVFALGFASIILGETLNFLKLIAAALVISGLTITLTQGSKAAVANK